MSFLKYQSIQDFHMIDTLVMGKPFLCVTSEDIWRSEAESYGQLITL